MSASFQSYRIHKIKQFVLKSELPEPKRTGRPSTLRDVELLAILIWDGVCEQHQTVKGVYEWIKRDYSQYWPNPTRLRHLLTPLAPSQTPARANLKREP